MIALFLTPSNEFTPREPVPTWDVVLEKTFNRGLQTKRICVSRWAAERFGRSANIVDCEIGRYYDGYRKIDIPIWVTTSVRDNEVEFLGADEIETDDFTSPACSLEDCLVIKEILESQNWGMRL